MCRNVIDNFRVAYEYVEKMRARRILLGPYLDQEMVETIYAQVGVAPVLDEEDIVDEDIAQG